MNKARIRQIGTYAGFLILPLALVGVIILLTYRAFNLAVIIDLIAIAVAVIVFAATNPIVIRDALGRRTVSTWVNTTLLIVGFAGIMVLINILATRAVVRADTTSNGEHSISAATVKVVENLKQPVTVYVAYSQNSATTEQTASDLLDEYRQHSDKLTVNTIDLDTNPQAAVALGVKSDPDFIFVSGTGKNPKRQETTTADEQSFTRALLALESTTQYRAFFVTGQGEPPISTDTNASSAVQTSFNAASTSLSDNNFLVDTLNLDNNSTSNTAITGTVTLNPATDVLIIAAPNQPFNQTQLGKITAFIKQGGKALILDDWQAQFPSQGSEATDNLNTLLSGFGVSFQKGVILEQNPSNVGFQQPAAIIPSLANSSSDIVRGMPNPNTLVMANAAPIKQLTSSPVTATETYTPLYNTSPQSFLVTDPTSNSIDPSKSPAGPFTVAASLEIPISGTNTVSNTSTPANSSSSDQNTARIALFGSYLWASDAQSVGFTQANSFTLFQNTMNWLVAQTNAITIPPKADTTHPFTISASQDTFVFYSTFIGLPLLVLFLGLLVWWRRR